MNRKPKVAVIGGGIGGLATAIALQQRGMECDVYEQADAFSDIGAGLNLSPNALLAFRMLGVEEQMVVAGFQDDYQYVRNWQSGAVTAQQSRKDGVLEKYGAPFLTIHRADVQSILLQKIPERNLHTGLACVSVENTSAGAAAILSNDNAIEADIVMGADGIHSAVRDSLFGAQPPKFTGCICYRGMAPYEALAHLPAAQGLNAWWGPSGHVVYYRVRKGTLVNFVAHYDSKAWTEESWTHECEREEVLNAFAGWNKNLLELFGYSERYYKWALYDRDPLPQWGRGRISLLGDSVHPMLPYLGQGAAMALEDACILARVLEQYGENAEAALRRYEAIRAPRTAHAQLASRERARQNHLTSPLARMWRDAGVAFRSRFGKDKSTLRADWVYRHNVADTSLDP